MPIVFESPQPFSASAYASRGLSGGAGDMGRYSMQQAQLMADVNAAYARNQMQDRAQAEERKMRMAQIGLAQQPSARDQFMQDAELARMAEHADNQAWLQQQELTQRDQARLQQMNQAVSAVQADQTLTADEKQRAITQLRTGIDPLHFRLQTQAAQADAKYKNARAEEAMSQAALQSKQLEGLSAQMSGRTIVLINEGKKSYYAQMARDAGLDPNTPEGKSFMQEQASENGHAQTGYVNAKNEFVTLEGGIGGKGAAGSRAAGGRPIPEELSAQQNATHYETAVKLANEEIKNGIATPDKRDELVAQHMANIQKFTGKSRQEAGQALANEQVGKIEVLKSTVADKVKSGYATERDGMVANNILDEWKRLTKKYPPHQRPQAIQARIDALSDQYQNFLKALEMRESFRAGGVGETAKGATPPPPEQPQGNMVQRFGQWTDRNLSVHDALGNILSGRLPGAEGIPAANQFSDENLNIKKAFGFE